MRRFFVPGGKWTQWSASSSTAITGPEKPFSAPSGGMLSGRAASRTGQLSDTASQHTFGGWQGGHHRRWQIYVSTSRNHYTRHRGWSTHLARERYCKAQPNQLAIRISRYIRRPRRECEASTAQASLEWHRPTSHQQNVTHGRAQRPSPTQRIWYLQRKRYS